MPLNVEHLRRTADTLDEASAGALRTGHALRPVPQRCSQELRVVAGNPGKLLRKALKLYGGSPREVDRLVFKDLFRHACKHGLLDETAVERWFAYCVNRNNTAHDYGVGFANETLKILPAYLQDARALADALQELFDA